jgi:hypothetical protein
MSMNRASVPRHVISLVPLLRVARDVILATRVVIEMSRLLLLQIGSCRNDNGFVQLYHTDMFLHGYHGNVTPQYNLTF